MDRPGDDAGSDGPPGVTRRTVLACSVATGCGFVAVPGGTSARQGLTPAVIPSPEEWADNNLAGYMIHVGRSQDPEATRVAETCEFRDWPPDAIRAYEATLINRKDADTPERETDLHVGADVDVPPGALYLINTFERCENEYIGVELEQIGRRDVDSDNPNDAPVVEVEDDSRPNTQTEGAGAIGPGFGVLGTIGALLGGMLIARLRDD